MAEAEAFAVPSVTDELNRKVLETLEQLNVKREAQLISEIDFLTSLETINSCCLGLIDKDVSTWISQYLAAAQETGISEKRGEVFRVDRRTLFGVFLSSKAVTSVMLKSDSEISVAGRVYTGISELSPDVACANHFRDKLLKASVKYKPVAK